MKYSFFEQLTLIEAVRNLSISTHLMQHSGLYGRMNIAEWRNVSPQYFKPAEDTPFSLVLMLDKSHSLELIKHAARHNIENSLIPVNLKPTSLTVKRGDIVYHQKTHGVYVVLSDNAIATGPLSVPVHAYAQIREDISPENWQVFTRPSIEMQDGRFEILATAAFLKRNGTGSSPLTVP